MYLGTTETLNGFGNRFLWVCVRRSKELPEGGRVPSLHDQIRHLERAASEVRRGGEIRRDGAARDLWHSVYGRLSEGRPGLLGAMTARAEAHVMRLACLYALADISYFVREEHLRAALDLWRYCFDSARYLFGDRLGDRVADDILAAIRRAYPESLTRTEISDVFKRNKSAAEIGRALDFLKQQGLADCELDRHQDGRPTERWVYRGDELDELNEISAEVLSLSSFHSSIGAA
jgi:hypothetical protein